MIDINGKTIQIGDIVKISNSPVKSDNALYVVAHDGTDLMYNGKDLTMYKVSKTAGGYAFSRAKYNIAFYPLVCFSNKYKYGRKELDAATIEIIANASPERLDLIKTHKDYEPEPNKTDYYHAVITDKEKEIDVSYPVSQAKKLTAFLSNIIIKEGQKLSIVKYTNIPYYRVFPYKIKTI